MKKYLKKNKLIYQFLIYTREKLRIIYNTKTRSRYLWRLKNGDEKLSLDYPLNSDSIVFDIGAFEGNFTKKVIDRFNCNIYAFEPLDDYYEKLVRDFKKIKSQYF